MNSIKTITIVFLFLLNVLSVHSQITKKPSIKTEFSGHFRGDFHLFLKEGLLEQQKGNYFSTVFQPEFLMDWDKGNQLFKFTGFFRLNQYNDINTHVDIREFYWQKFASKWDLSIGVKQLFWGVTESNHLVDIINQYDMLEGIDVEQKLGQPMVHLSLGLNWGTIDLIGTIYSRKLKLAEPQGRLRPPIKIDYNDAQYESNMQEYKPEFAIRWSKSIKAVDIGLSHFYGNTRLPQFISKKEKNVPYYEKINHTSIDIQVLTNSMLLKIEAIHQFRENDRIFASTFGGEYTLNNIFSKATEVVLMAEYTYDERGQTVLNGLNNDVFFASRILFKDKQSTDITVGFLMDTELETRIYSLEFNRRIKTNWKLQLNTRIFENVNRQDLFYYSRNDSYLQVTMIYYF